MFYRSMIRKEIERRYFFLSNSEKQENLENCMTVLRDYIVSQEFWKGKACIS